MKQVEFGAREGEVVSRTALLARIADELSRLRQTSLIVQEAASDLSFDQSLSSDRMRDLQRMDLITQVIDDLERVTRWMSDRLDDPSHPVPDLEKRIKLRDVSARLTGAVAAAQVKPPPDDGEVAFF